MGHDLGHTPFGHAGEKALAEVHPGGFRHNVQSIRVCDVLEISRARQGMNLTEEVRDGILNHTGPDMPFTLEGQIVRTADRIAYVNHDTDDALRCGIIMEEDLPDDVVKILGTTTGARINTLTRDMVQASDGTGDIRQSKTCLDVMNKLRAFLFERVYYSDRVAEDAKRFEIDKVIPGLYNHYLNQGFTHEAAKDHLAGMTDRYAMEVYTEL